MKNTVGKRILSVLLVFVLMLGCLPVSALAEETTAAEEPVETAAETVPEAIAETEPEAIAETEPETIAETEPETIAETESETIAETEPEILLPLVPEIVPEDEQAEGSVAPEGEFSEEDLTFNLAEDGVIIMDGSTEGTVKVKRNITGTVIDNIPTSETITITGGPVTCQNGKCKEIKADTARPVTIRLRNVRLDNETINGHCAMTLNGANGASAKVTLILEGENFIRGGRDNAGVRVPEGAELTIRGEGSLEAIGRDGSSAGAGIGGAVNQNCGTVRIESGTIIATGDNMAAGIGGGGMWNGNGTKGGTIIITGGIVTATGGNNAAGIGGGYLGSGGAVTVTGGIVTATGGTSAEDIGAGYNGQAGTVSISGGVVFEGNSGTVYGNTTLAGSFTIPAGKTLTIPQSASLTIPEGTTLTIQSDGILTNYGTVTNYGTITNEGTIINEGSLPSGISGKITHAQHNYVSGFCTKDNCDDPYQPATPADGVYQITNAGNLFWFADYVNSGTVNAEAKVTQDITMPKDRAWGGIGTASYYSGSFDGNDKTITGLTGTEGLVKYLDGTVKNVILKDVNISRSGDNLGAVAGHCTKDSRIENCYSSGTVAGGGTSIGGIAGWMQGTMVGCISECAVSGSNSGGLVGSGVRNSAPSPAMSNCLYLGSKSIEGDQTHLRSKTLNVFHVNGDACTRYYPGESVAPGKVYVAMHAYSVFRVVADRFPAPVPYINTEGNEETCYDYTPVTGATTTLGTGWYVVKDSVRVSGAVTVSGDAHLILTDGCRLTVNGGIQTEPGNQLTVYRQAAGTGQIDNVSLPAITRQPEAVTMVEGEDRSLSVEYTNGTVCQWYRDGKAVEGATGSSYALAALKAGIYQFHCEITSGGFIVASRSVTVTVKLKATNPIRFTQEYMTLEVGSHGQLTLESDTPELLDRVTYRAEPADSVDMISSSGAVCEFTPLCSGTVYVIAEVTMGGDTYSARCRVDVTEAAPKEAVRGVQLGTTALTTELLRRDYAEFDVILLLEQNQTLTADAITPDGAAPENNGVAITSAKFADAATAKLFDLVVKDDRTLLVVPTQAAIDSPKSVAGKYSSPVTVTAGEGEKTFTTDTALTLTVKKSTPKLKATALTFNSFYPGQSQVIKLTGATATNYALTEGKTQPEWLDCRNVANGVLTLTENPTGKKGNVYVTVTAEGWAKDFDIAVPVKLTYAAPKLKLSATTVTFADLYNSNNQGVKLQLLCANKKDTLEALNVKDIQAPEGFVIQNFDPTDGSFILKPTKAVTAGTKEITVSFLDTKQTVTLNLKVKTKAVSFSLKTSKITLNSDLPDTALIPITITPADYVLTKDRLELAGELTDSKGNPVGMDELQYNLVNVLPDRPSMLLAVACGPNVKPNATYKLSCWVKDSGKKATLTIKTQPKGKVIIISEEASGAIDPMDPTSIVKVKHTSRTVSIVGDVRSYTVTAYKAGDMDGEDVTDLFNIGYAPWCTSMPDINSAEDYASMFEQIYVWSTDYPAIDPSLTYKLELGYGDSINSEVVLPVKHTPIKLKLSKTSLSLNKAVNDKAVLDLTCQTKGYELENVVLPDEYMGDNAPLNVNFADGKLTVAINSNTQYGATYKIPIQATKYDPAVTLTVKIPAEDKSTVTASLKAKGAIDVVRDSTAITVTPSYKNYMGLAEIKAPLTIESWSGKKGEDYLAVAENLFDVQFANGSYTIKKVPGAEVDTTLKYRAKLTFNGGAKPAYVNLAVKSGTAKVSVSGTPVLYKTDRFSRGTFRLTTADKALNSIVKAEIKDAKYQNLFAIHSYGNGEFAIGFKDNTVPTGKLPTKLTLNVYADGNSAKSVAAVTLKLQVR